MNRIKHLCILLLGVSVFLTPRAMFAQDSSGSYAREGFPSYLVFLEAGGHALVSVNFERYVSNHIGIRIGYGAFVPLLVNYYAGDNYLVELGGGVIYSPHEALKPFTDKKNAVLLGATIGHKYQPNDGGPTLRYSFTPILNPVNGRVIPMFGLSSGWAFR